jgi:hypothetical protein
MKRYYSEQLLNDINQRIYISDIVSETVKLTRKGNRYWGLCPFHQEKTPSFSVAPDKNLFYCFGCHAGGNIFTYIMKRDGLDFAEAVEVLAGRAGVALELNEGRSKREDEIKKRVLEVNQAAAQFFNQMLCQSTNPLEYIKGRGVNLDTIKQFQLGYALDSWNALEEYLLEEALYEFPVQEVNIKLPGWVEELDEEFWLREDLETAIHEILTGVRKVRDIETALQKLSEVENISYVLMEEMNLGTGTAAIDITVPEELFYRSLSEVSGFDVAGTQDIMRIMKDLSFAKKEFDKVSSALAEVKESGYGVVTPRLEEMFLEEPELIRQGSRFGVRLKAKAPSLHIIRADITTEITPIIGTEKQCEELVRYMLDEFEEDPTKIWESNIFGKSLHDLVREGIQNKLHRMPENAQLKLQDTLQRIVNDGSGGLICIII